MKRARRSKKSKDSEYLYFDDTDTEEDGTKKADTTEKDHSFSSLLLLRLERICQQHF